MKQVIIDNRKAVLAIKEHLKAVLTTMINFGTPEDIIAAIATPRGAGAIAIIRVSGKNSLQILEKIVSENKREKIKNATLKTMSLIEIIDPQTGKPIDKAMFSVFKAPNSYTGDDLFEIFCHGGRFLTEKILNVIIANGARHALPGEFTARAFLNRKIDLTQAEAVNNIVNSRNDLFLENSLKQLSGSLGKPIRQQRETLLNIIANIEVAIEYPEENFEDIPRETTKKQLIEVSNSLQKIIDRSSSAHSLNEGVRVAIVGKPNVGKSSLMNKLIGEERAIVSDIPGTTRDVVGDWISFSGMDFYIMDTAGIRERSPDTIENIGISKTFDSLNSSDLVLCLFDNSCSWSETDDLVINTIKHASKIIPVITKCDLSQKLDFSFIKSFFNDIDPIVTSSVSGIGIDRLIAEIKSKGELISSADMDIWFISARNRNLLETAVNNLNDCLEAFDSKPSDLICIDLRAAIDNLGKITGESFTEDLYSTIFSNFCVGK